MNHRILFILIILGLSSLTYCSKVSSEDKKNENNIHGSITTDRHSESYLDGIYIKQNAVSYFEAAVFEGKTELPDVNGVPIGNIGFILAVHHASSRRSNANHTEVRNAFNKSVYWARIAAENGETESMLLLSDYYSSAGGQQNCIRSEFWLKKAISISKAEDRQRFQNQIDVLQLNKKSCVAGEFGEFNSRSQILFELLKNPL
jgi:TPR repeat protein